mgnify:CR=1 FL=1
MLFCINYRFTIIYKINMIKTILAVYLLIQLNLVVCKLVFVQVLFRHGTRYPLHPSEIDGTEYAALENMSGELAN